MAFETTTISNYAALFDRVRAALKDAAFMGYDVVVSGGSGTFTLGEAVSFSSSTVTAVVRQVGAGYLLLDTVANGAPPEGETVAGGTSGATATVTSATSRAWTEIVYDTPGAANVDKRVCLKNTGDSGADEIWITIEQITAPSGVAGIRFNGSFYYDAVTGGWAGLSLIGNNGYLPMPNTGNATRDEMKYWLVADRKRMILAVHLEYLLGAGEVMWIYDGYLTRWDPPSQYPQPHIASTCANEGTLYTAGATSIGFRDSAVGVDPDTGASGYLVRFQAEPKIANPDGSHALLPLWMKSNGSPGVYAGELDGLFLTDPLVAQGDTFTIGAATYVCLQDYNPGHYAALKLW